MNMNFKVHIGRIIDLDPIEFLNNSTGVIDLTTDDDVVTTVNHRELALSLFVAKFHRQFNAPFLHTHLVSKYFGDFGYTSKTFTKWTNVVMWDVYDHALKYYSDSRQLFTEITKLFITIVGDVYCGLVGPTRQYMLAVALPQCHAIYDHPKMRALREIEAHTPREVSNIIDQMTNLLVKDKDLTDNLSIICKIGCVRTRQVAQCLGKIGYRSEVDGTVFSTAIHDTYLEGLNSTYAQIAEARTSSIAQLATMAELQDNEYTSRKTCLGLVSVTGIDEDDCGSTRTIDWLVQPENVSPHIKNMKGTWYIREDGEYDYIRGDETHLEGKVIKVRTALSCLNLPITGKVCRKCYGKSAESHPRHFHLGYVASVDGYSRQSQGAMSRKHHIGSADVVVLPLTDTEIKYLHPKGTSEYYITDRVLKHTSRLVFQHKDAVGLNAVMYSNMADYTEESVSALPSITFVIEDKNGDSEVVGVNTSLLKNSAHLSFEMLKYIKARSADVVLDSNGMYSVPLDGWDHKSPALTMSAISVSEATDHDALYDSVGGRVEALRKRGVVVTPVGMLMHLFDILSLSGCQLCDVATTTLSVLSEDPAAGKYQLGVTGMDSVPTQLQHRIMSMSAAVTQAFERHHLQGFNFMAMMPNGRMSTAMDTVMMPTLLNRYYQ